MPQLFDFNGFRVSLDKIVDQCPHCRASITPVYLMHRIIVIGDKSFFQLVYSCPNDSCQQTIVVTYQHLISSYFLTKIEPPMQTG